jgi:hypothetical protein
VASWWLIPTLIILLSRLWGALLVNGLGADVWARFGSPPAAGPATLWDGAWYLEIARFGYHATPVARFLGDYYDFSFWPAWPALLGAVLRTLPLAPDVAAAALANGLSLIALLLWVRVLEPLFGRSVARYAIAFIAFAPSAFVLSMGYSEPLFLLIGALFFLVAASGPARPLLAALAQATRLTGFALGAVALPALWRKRGRDRGAWLLLLAPLLVGAAWWIAIAILTGNPFGYMLGSPAWLAASGQTGGPLSFFADGAGGPGLLPIGISAAFVALICTGTFLLARAHRYELALYAAAAVLPSLALANWQSMPRHLLIAVPAAAALMAALSPRWRRLLLLASFGAELSYAIFVLKGQFAP